LAQRRLMPGVRDAGEIAGQFQAHPLPGGQIGTTIVANPFKEIADRNAEDMGDLVEPTSADAVDPAFIFMGLLVGDANHVSHLLLAVSKHYAAFPDSAADMPVSVGGAVHG